MQQNGEIVWPQSAKQLMANLKQNKKQMAKILAQAPTCGIYKNENPQQWDNFFKFYINFMKSELGPRGDCSKKVRNMLLQDEQNANKILGYVGMTSTSHIRDIYIKYKNWIPCPQYTEKQKLIQFLIKAKDTLQKYKDPNSILCQKIKEGMRKKYGEQNYEKNFEQQIQTSIKQYTNKNNQAEKRLVELQEFLDKNQQYWKYIAVQNYMNKYFEMWLEADRNIGKQGVNRGQKFEEKVQKFILPVILEARKQILNGQVHVFTNAKWNPKTLGEIDIAIGYEKDKSIVIKILIQCKARLFDLREAFKQVNSEEIKLANKTILSTNKGLLKLDDNVEHFIVTTLPENPFQFPVESKLKETLDKSSKNIPINEIDKGQLYKLAHQKFKEDFSPLQWFKKYDSERIIVLNQVVN